ncbi:hypothetical protein GKA01_10860 [Gluconobacter kanchanaburiensis NBRC 103587]|uniref:Peptidoglycan binding-like domain-containing protein n=2 Tax=Gluconobacter kanchanaburiensis TaxID=563199 RepID=A0A511B623_9PROT|nr:hypothetical protein AA103587_2174 [Gluconobacter kanchanaburiensis NBRC 103587]GEK95889.1 hypothetical protein GKA01_10860 [Gluconobacter kanchanaburiensis NBRC 103587]
MFRELFLCTGMIACTIGGAAAQSYSPDFDCSRVNPTDSIAELLCHNSDSAKSELIFDQTYYALRQQVGRQGWQSLKREVIADQQNTASCIHGNPDPNNTQALPVDPICYQEKTAEVTNKYRSQLSGAALEEASRPIDRHIALQQKLVDLGYLPSGTKADGIYGEGTRQAIMTWQRVSGRPASSGFISNEDASVLLSGGKPAVAQPKISTTEETNTSAIVVPDNEGIKGIATYGKDVWEACSGQINSIPFNGGRSFNPFATEGLCYELTIGTMAQPQWLDANSALFISVNSDVYPNILVESDGPLQIGKDAVVIGVKPQQYTSALGALETPMTVKVLKYYSSFGR